MLPQAALLHWIAAGSFTLALQLSLRSDRIRTALGYAVAPQRGSGAGDAGASAGGVDPSVAAVAATTDSADVLVVMAAKHAALQRHADALYCLGRALELQPDHARAHYSAGQVHALRGDWPAAEEAYLRCAAATAEPHTMAQAYYCAGVAAHQQGHHEAALQAFEHVQVAPGLEPALALARVRALAALGRHADSAATADAFLSSDAVATCPDDVVAALREASTEACEAENKGK
jgi:Tetratricopeptide repeat